MKFTKVIESTSDHRAMDGFVFTGTIEFNEEGKAEYLSRRSENRWFSEIDDFRDGWDDICRNEEDGKLYLVRTDANSHLVLMWQPVETDDRLPVVEEVRGRDLEGFAELKNGSHFIYENGYSWHGIKLSDSFAVLFNADGKLIIAEAFRNCLSIGSGFIDEYSTLEETNEVLFSLELSKAIAGTGLTLREVAEKIEVPYRTIQSWKLGDRTPSAGVQKMTIAAIRGIK